MAHYLEEDWAELEKDSIIENLQIERDALKLREDKVRQLLAEWQNYCLANMGQTLRLMQEVTDLLDGKPVFAGSKQL